MLSTMEDEEANLIIDLSPEPSSDYEDPATPERQEDTDGDCFRIYREYHNENSNFSQDCSTAVPSPSPSSNSTLDHTEDSQTSSHLDFETINEFFNPDSVSTESDSRPESINSSNKCKPGCSCSKGYEDISESDDDDDSGSRKAPPRMILRTSLKRSDHSEGKELPEKTKKKTKKDSRPKIIKTDGKQIFTIEQAEEIIKKTGLKESDIANICIDEFQKKVSEKLTCVEMKLLKKIRLMIKNREAARKSRTSSSSLLKELEEKNRKFLVQLSELKEANLVRDLFGLEKYSCLTNGNSYKATPRPDPLPVKPVKPEPPPKVVQPKPPPAPKIAKAPTPKVSKKTPAKVVSKIVVVPSKVVKTVTVPVFNPDHYGAAFMKPMSKIGVLMDDLGKMPLKELNKRIKKFHLNAAESKLLKEKRRTLKNRQYAVKSRGKKSDYVKNLKHQNEALAEEIEELRTTTQTVSMTEISSIRPEKEMYTKFNNSFSKRRRLQAAHAHTTSSSKAHTSKSLPSNVDLVKPKSSKIDPVLTQIIDQAPSSPIQPPEIDPVMITPVVDPVAELSDKDGIPSAPVVILDLGTQEILEVFNQETEVNEAPASETEERTVIQLESEEETPRRALRSATKIIRPVSKKVTKKVQMILSPEMLDGSDPESDDPFSLDTSFAAGPFTEENEPDLDSKPVKETCKPQNRVTESAQVTERVQEVLSNEVIMPTPDRFSGNRRKRSKSGIHNTEISTDRSSTSESGFEDMEGEPSTMDVSFATPKKPKLVIKETVSPENLLTLPSPQQNVSHFMSPMHHWDNMNNSFMSPESVYTHEQEHFAFLDDNLLLKYQDDLGEDDRSQQRSNYGTKDQVLGQFSRGMRSQSRSGTCRRSLMDLGDDL